MKFQAIVKQDTKVLDAIRLMSSSDRTKYMAGIAVVVDNNNKVIGVLTDGDIRRGLSLGKSIDDCVSAMANLSPLTVRQGFSKQQMRKQLIWQAKKRNSDYRKFNKVVLVNEHDEFQDVIWLSELLDQQVDEKVVAVYGLGFVGLTLAAVLANTGLSVTGIDKNESLITGLRRGRPHFHENGLESLLLSLNQSNPILFTNDPSESDADIHIICVGTPADSSHKPDFRFITEVSRGIAAKLKKNDLVVLRSTLPVGTTRQVIVPILENGGLKAGDDFYVAFAPERTIEGNALEELRTLPQIIGGYNKPSSEMTAKLFNKVTSAIIEVDSLEAAEMVKLMNNAFRDLVFSFANEVATVCDGININAFKLIEAANEGYPRNPIPSPSPGVGGVCLSKDPYLYSFPTAEIEVRPVLSQISRSINSIGHKYVFEKIRRFCSLTNQSIEGLKIFLIGLAFKGMPETSDTRESTAIKLLDLLPSKSNIRIKDFVVPDSVITATGCHSVENVMDGFVGSDIVLVMNNHYQNNKFNVVEAIGSMNKPLLFFDGWNMFNQIEIERVPGAHYATMGYLTERSAVEYYRILPLIRDASLFLEGDKMTVDLDAADDRASVSNDESFLSVYDPRIYFWLSGGGTYLVNNKYLIVVRRGLGSGVNPGKYSLFTGRVDNEAELVNPSLMVRELFEELVLFSEGRLCYPICEPWQDLIDNIYAGLRSKFGIQYQDTLPLHLSPCRDHDQRIAVKRNGKSREFKLNFHINGRQDINVLFLLSANIDISKLSAIDGEYIDNGGLENSGSRDIFLFDPLRSEARLLSGSNRVSDSVQTVDDAEMTEHLRFLVNQVRKRLAV